MYDPRHRFLISLGCLLAIGALLFPASAADAPLRKRAVDLLILDDHTRLLGVLLNPQEDAVHRILLQADWLQSHQPELFEQITKAAESKVADTSPLVTRLQMHLRILMAAESLLGHRCRLIAYGGQYYPADQESFNPAELLPNLLQSALQNQLLNLLSEPSVLGAKFKSAAGSSSVSNQTLEPAAAAIAARQNANLVQVTRMRMDIARTTAPVRIDVYFRAPQDTAWKRMTQVLGSATGKDVTAEAKQHTANDPRVTQVTDLFAGLGADTARLSTALTVGAVVQAAQNKAQQRLADDLSGFSTSIVPFQMLEATLPDEPPKPR